MLPIMVLYKISYTSGDHRPGKARELWDNQLLRDFNDIEAIKIRVLISSHNIIYNAEP